MDREPPLFLPDAEVDPLEFKIRLACGALFGVLVGGVIGLRFYEAGWIWHAMIVSISVLGCSWAAARYGDGFWLDAIPSLRRLW